MEEIGKKPVSASLSPSQVGHALIYDWSRASTLRGRWLTACRGRCGSWCGIASTFGLECCPCLFTSYVGVRNPNFAASFFSAIKSAPPKIFFIHGLVFLRCCYDAAIFLSLHCSRRMFSEDPWRSNGGAAASGWRMRKQTSSSLDLFAHIDYFYIYVVPTLLITNEFCRGLQMRPKRLEPLRNINYLESVPKNEQLFR